MTSKNLFFKLMKADLKGRLWAVALIGLTCFFTYPVVTVFMAGDIRQYADITRGILEFQELITWWLSAKNGFTVFGMIIAALICGLSSFSYLNSRIKVDFFHSIPVKREKLYFANYLNGILIILAPYGISLAAAAVIAAANGANPGLIASTAICAFGFHMVYFMLMYSTVIVAVMLTGNMIISFLGSVVLAFFIPGAVLVQQAYFESFFHSHQAIYISDLVSEGIRISPVMEYIYQVGRYNQNSPMAGAVLLALAVTLVLAGIGCTLYRYRASEAAGKAMAFAVSKPVVRILLSFFSAMSMGLFFWAFNRSNGWGIFGIFCGGIISHCIIEIIYHFDFKKLFAHRIQMAICTLAALAVFFVFRYDLLGYDSYIPPAEKIREAAVDMGTLNSWISYGEVQQNLSEDDYLWEGKDGKDYIFEHMHNTENIEEIRQIASMGIQQIEEAKRGQEDVLYGEETAEAEDSFYGEIDQSEEKKYTRVNICYILNGGRKVYRSYYLSVEDIAPQLEKMISNRQYLEGVYPIMTRSVDEISNISYRELEQQTKLDRLTETEKQQLLTAYQEELSGLTLERMEQEAPVGLIRFTTYDHDKAIQAKLKKYQNRSSSWEVEHLEERDYYPVYPSFKKTISLLKENGINAGEAIIQMDIREIAITGSLFTTKSRSGETDTELTISDPKEIAALKPLMVKSEITYYNPLFKVSQISGEIRSGKSWSGEAEYLYVTFPFGKVPDLIKEKLQ